MKNKDISFVYNSFGKPYLLKPKGLFLNVSHSGKWVVCITHNQEVGVDIEKIRPVDIQIFERLFTVEEVRAINNKKKTERLYEYYQLWTKKEGFVKMIGRGLAIPLNSNCSKCKGVFSVRQTYINSLVFFKHYTFESDYVITACARDDSFPDKLEIVEFSS
ncbi:4'-phosphopantetheinyl transferase superfamily protein [Brevibacillus laterosporus]|nr:4'-phosphopantetheinyl transferase superfamily protein [Brevibacillus laterosporus]MED1790168.1 4'-phosphopantetheinyl transferase superfamily protein [Brevibacillus laterosporus]